MDFEVYDGIVCILQGNGSQYRLLLADEDITVFYRIDAETKEKQPLFINDGSDAYLDYINEIKYHLKNPLEAGRTVKLEDWERYVRLFWYRDSSAHLALADDKLVFFDNDHGVIHEVTLSEWRFNPHCKTPSPCSDRDIRIWPEVGWIRLCRGGSCSR